MNLTKFQFKLKIEIFLNVCLALLSLLLASFLILIGEILVSLTLWFIFAVFIMLIMRRYLEVKKDAV